jgi:hypothetical protein
VCQVTHSWNRDGGRGNQITGFAQAPKANTASGPLLLKTQDVMSSKIPLPSSHGQRTGAAVHFPADGHESPVGGGRPMSMSSGVSGTPQSSSFLHDTRRKQNKRDEVIVPASLISTYGWR